MQAFEDDYFSKMGPRSSSAFGKTRESCQKQKRHDMSAPVRAQPGKESVPASRKKAAIPPNLFPNILTKERCMITGAIKIRWIKSGRISGQAVSPTR